MAPEKELLTARHEPQIRAFVERIAAANTTHDRGVEMDRLVGYLAFCFGIPLARLTEERAAATTGEPVAWEKFARMIEVAETPYDDDSIAGAVILTTEFARTLLASRGGRHAPAPQVAALTEEAERVKQVILRRHNRLSAALGDDPGYSVDMTIDKAIDRLASLSAALEEAKANLAFEHDEKLVNVQQIESLLAEVDSLKAFDPIRRLASALRKSLPPEEIERLAKLADPDAPLNDFLEFLRDRALPTGDAPR